MRGYIGALFLGILLFSPVYVFPRDRSLIHPEGVAMGERIKTPPGYRRITVGKGSFGEYLRNLKLKPNGELVHYFDGRIKNNDGIYVAVIDMPIGNRDLQQCADVIMHLRAEYLWTHNQADKIHFNFLSGFRADYTRWKNGYRISTKGGKNAWVKSSAPNNSYESFCVYMDLIYQYCNTLSLSRELRSVTWHDIQPGDLLIKGGSPGHAELVMDVAQNSTGEKIYLLAQGYMPAQEMQVLTNPEDNSLSPWYKVDESKTAIITPQWTFTTNQLMRFENE